MTRAKEIQQLIDEENYTYNYGSSDYQIGVCDGVRLADKTMIERVLNFINTYFYEEPYENIPIFRVSFESLEQMKEELIKAMKE